MDATEDIIFTKYALLKLRERNISKRLVAITVRSPQKMVFGGSKSHAFRKFGSKYLKVVFVRVRQRS